MSLPFVVKVRATTPEAKAELEDVVILLTNNEKVNVDIRDLDENQKNRLRKSKPATMYKADLGVSLDRYRSDMKDLVEWWKGYINGVKSSKDRLILNVNMTASVNAFNACLTKLEDTSKLKIWFKLLWTSPAKLTAKMFGEYIKIMYYSRYMVQTAKEQFIQQMESNKFGEIFTEELLNEANEYVNNVIPKEAYEKNSIKKD